jgi:hypothetical protein
MRKPQAAKYQYRITTHSSVDGRKVLDVPDIGTLDEIRQHAQVGIDWSDDSTPRLVIDINLIPVT